MAGSNIHVPAPVSADARERLQALGYVDAQTDLSIAPGRERPDPKDKSHILETYRAAVDLAAQGKWPAAILRLQQILREDSGLADVWSQLAAFAGRLDRLDLTAGEMGSNGTPEERIAEAEAARLVLGADWRLNLRWPDRRIGKDPDHLDEAVSFIRRHRPKA